MKKLNKLLFTLLILVVGINGVKALTLKRYNYDEKYGYTAFNDKNNWFRFTQYAFYDGSNNEYVGYCRNAGLNAGSSDTNYTCNGIVGKSNTKIKQAYDAGIIYIVENGYYGLNGISIENEEFYKEYVKTNVALRVYEMLWLGGLNTNKPGALDSNGYKYYSAHLYYVNEFLNSKYNSILNEINKAAKEGYVKTSPYKSTEINKWTWRYTTDGENFSNEPSDLHDDILKLINGGLGAAKKQIEEGNKTPSLKLEKQSSSILEDKTYEREDQKKTAEQAAEVEYKIYISNFKYIDSLKLVFDCPKCQQKNIDYDILIDNRKYDKNELQRVNNTIDLQDANVRDGDSVVIKFYGTEKTPLCNLDYKIEVKSKANYSKVTINECTSEQEACENGGNCQNFYVIVPEGKSEDGKIEKSVKINDTISLSTACDTSCFNLYMRCNSGLEDSCETYVEKKCCLEHELACRNSNAGGIRDKETNNPVNCDIPDMYCPLKCIVTNGDSNPNQYGYGYTGEIVDKDTWYMECDNNTLTCDDLETGKISKYPEGKLYNYINYRGEFKYNKTYSYIVRDCKPQNPTYDCENPYLESDGTYTFTDDSGISHTKVNKEQYIRICKNNVDGNKCTTLVGNATCTDTLNDSVKIQEGMKKESGSVCEIPTKSDVTNCIINYEDAVGNSYEATKLFKDNKYCQVWCKEDYYVKLPGVQSTDKGRYFSLSAQVDGSKTCYTSKLDRDSFENDFEDKRQDIINNYNLWSFYNAASKKTGKNVTFEFTAYNPYARDKVEVLKDFKVFELQSGISGCQVSGNNIKCTYYSNDKNIQDVYTSKKVSDASKNLTKSINDLNTIESTYNSCTSWTMSYNFDPQITFDYSEEYMTNIKNKGLDALVVNSSHDDKPKIEYCEASISYDYSNMSLSKDVVDDSYDTCTSGGFKIASNTSSIPTEQITKMVCSDNSTNGTNFSCKLITFNITKTLRLKETMPSTAEFSVPTVAFTLHPSGTVVIDTEENALKNTNVTPLVNKLPISFATSSGVYNYSLSVKDLGEHYDTGKLGRIWGDIKSGKEKDSVVVHINKLKDAAKCTPDSIVNNGKYICRYIVDCPDCPTTCEPPCEIKDPPYCENDKCPTTCESCILNKDINYRPITPNDINPNDRTLGDNWNTKDSITEINTAVELKAFATIEEIQTNGETIYEYDVSKNPSNTGKDFAMKIVLDNNAKKIIRNYNNEMKSEGGYANNSLKCYDYIDGKTTYKNVFCYSELIDRLVGDSKVDIEFSTKRPLTDDERKGTLTQESGYFTPWDWGESTIATLHIPGNANIVNKNYGSSGIGPAWK